MRRIYLHILTALLLTAMLLAALLPWAGLAEEGPAGEEAAEIVADEAKAETAPGEAGEDSLLELAGGGETPKPTAEPTAEPTQKPPKIPWLTSFNYPKGKTNFEKEIWSIMTRKWGLSDFQAAGLMSSIQAESGFCPYNAEGIGGSDDRGVYKFSTDDSVGFGLCQWTTSGRKSALLSHAVAHGSEDLVWDFDIQMGFMGSELDIKGLRTAKSLYDVTEWAVLRYERPNLSYENSWPGARYERGKAIYRRHTGKDYEEPPLRFSAAFGDGKLAAGDVVRLDGDGAATLKVACNYYWRLEQVDSVPEGWLVIQSASPYRPDTLEDCVCGYASDGKKALKLTSARKPGAGETCTATLRFEIYRGDHEIVEIPVEFSGPERFRLTAAGAAGLGAALLGIVAAAGMV